MKVVGLFGGLEGFSVLVHQNVTILLQTPFLTLCFILSTPIVDTCSPQITLKVEPDRVLLWMTNRDKSLLHEHGAHIIFQPMFWKTSKPDDIQVWSSFFIVKKLIKVASCKSKFLQSFLVQMYFHVQT